MIGKALVRSIACVLLLVGCADPKYVSQNGAVSPNQKAEALRTRLPISQKAVWLEWEKKQTADDFGSFVVKIGRENLADKSAVPEDSDGEVAVVLWMPSMGHGSSPVRVDKVDVGTYRASQVFFTMPGDWEIRIQRFVNGAMVEQAVIALRF